MDFEPIKTDRLYVKVADKVSTLITSGKIKPGERLPSERDLAERLQVSRPTIREAMIALELSGIIEIRTGSGIYVTEKKPSLKINDKGVGPFEILESRAMIEVDACGLAATRINDEQIAQLRDALEEMKEEQISENPSEQADWKFHCIIAEATQNSAIYSIVNWLWELRNQSALSTSYLERIRKEGVRPAIEDHKKIIDALEKRDPVAAKKAMRQHIKRATAATAAHFET